MHVGELVIVRAEARPLTLVDVREPRETQAGVISGARLLPLRELLTSIGELRAAPLPLVLYCASGVRSANAALQLRDRGIEALSLDGGIAAWQLAGQSIAEPEKRLVKVARKSEIDPGTARSIDVAGRALALVRVGDAFYAVDGQCLHRGGSLGNGVLEGSALACPMHGWRYDVTTGRAEHDPRMALVCHRVVVDGDDILVQA
jgi:nitrite reductase/ring-hydroxylating ferredoxin subunit/rhodanese-related sulfurtransferase